MENMKRAIVSLSGGMDSSSLLANLLASNTYDTIHCYGFNYGQRHFIEMEKAENLVGLLRKLGHPVTYQVIDLRDVFDESQSALGSLAVEEVPKESYALENLTKTVVENRNVIFSSIIYAKALMISKKYDCDVDISLGVHNSDLAVYPDTRPESVNMAKELFKISNYGSERINYITPFLALTKVEVLGNAIESLKSLGIKAEDYFKETSSCYDPIDYHGISYSCGWCATCRDRLEAFASYNMEDPIPYSKDYMEKRTIEATKNPKRS